MFRQAVFHQKFLDRFDGFRWSALQHQVRCINLYAAYVWFDRPDRFQPSPADDFILGPGDVQDRLLTGSKQAPRVGVPGHTKPLGKHRWTDRANRFHDRAREHRRTVIAAQKWLDRCKTYERPHPSK